MPSNLYYHDKSVKLEDKKKKYGHESCVLWFTGLSGSGKSTLANLVETKLFDLGCKTHVLDGDNVRMGLNSDLGFSPEDRKENIRRIGEVANLFAESGTITLTAFISPYQADRDAARSSCKDRFIEVYVKADVQTCEERDPKGLYKKARAGIIKGFTGIDAPYEEPAQPEITVDSCKFSAEECSDQIVSFLVEAGMIPASLGTITTLDKRKTIAIDFDGVIHAYSQGFQGLDNAYDGIHPGALESIQALHSQGYRLVIVSSRPAHIIREWLSLHNIKDYFDEVTNIKRPAAFYIDDHAVEFKKGESDSWKRALTIIGAKI